MTESANTSICFFTSSWLPSDPNGFFGSSSESEIHLSPKVELFMYMVPSTSRSSTSPPSASIVSFIASSGGALV